MFYEKIPDTYKYKNIFYVLDCWSADGTLCYLWKKPCRLKYMLELADNLLLSPPFSTRNFGTIYYCQHPQFKSSKYAPAITLLSGSWQHQRILKK